MIVLLLHSMIKIRNTLLDFNLEEVFMDVLKILLVLKICDIEINTRETRTK